MASSYYISKDMRLEPTYHFIQMIFPSVESFIIFFQHTIRVRFLNQIVGNFIRLKEMAFFPASINSKHMNSIPLISVRDKQGESQ